MNSNEKLISQEDNLKWKGGDLRYEVVTKDEVVQNYNHQEESYTENLEDSDSESKWNDSVSCSSKEGEDDIQGGYSYEEENKLEYYLQTLVEEKNIQNKDMMLHESK